MSPLALCTVISAGTELDRWTLLWAGGWLYMLRLSGWSRRGRFPGYSSVVTANRQRLMAKHGSAFLYLLSATVRPDVADQALFLAAVIQPVCAKVRAWVWDTPRGERILSCPDPSPPPLVSVFAYRPMPWACRALSR